jgi:hypothetical protein
VQAELVLLVCTTCRYFAGQVDRGGDHRYTVEPKPVIVALFKFGSFINHESSTC